MSSRKTPQTWIDAGLKALKTSGPDGLRAETLARQIGTTKGSFYWHFKDVPAFHDAVLATWAEDARTRFDAACSKGDTTVTRLRALAGFAQKPVDRAVRGWAVQNAQAAKVVETLDAHMQSQIAALLSDLDATHPDFPGLIFATLIAAPKNGQHAETLIDLLLVLK